MKPVFLFFFFILPNLVYSQKLLKGVVLDAEKNTPLAGASVFLSNTSVGTVSNAQGSFELSIPAGRYDLIVSSVGFETSSQTINTAGMPASFTIQLRPKATELENVVVGAFEKDGWATWGKFFLENFIGTSAFARDCILKNKDAIRFRNSKKTGVLTATALEPLIIQNKALGYTVRYDLETFTYNFNTHILLYQGYPFFEAMNGSAARKRKWAARRRETYNGSLMHFMRSVYRNKISENNFEVRALQKINNTEKKRIQQLYRTGNVQPGTNKDSTNYYEKILRQPDQFDIIAKTLLPGDSIAYALDVVTAALDFSNYILVIYTKGVTAPEFRMQFPEAGSSMASQLQLPNRRLIAVQANGNFYEPADLLTMGYWSWSEKIATMLPFDYAISP